MLRFLISISMGIRVVTTEVDGDDGRFGAVAGRG